MNDLRKGSFTLAIPNASIGDYESGNENAEKKMKERKGFFHEWGVHICHDSENGRLLESSIGIVEEENTGKVYEVLPKNIIFLRR
jgi:hypothetical protein